MPSRPRRTATRPLVARAALVAALAAAPAAAVTLAEAVALHQGGRLDEALAAYREIAATASSDRDRSAARNNACVLLHDRGDAVPALPECAEAVRLRRAAGAERALAQSLNNWALALQASGARDEARRRMAEALELNDRLGETEEAVVNLDNLAAFEIENGRYGDALDRLAAAERRVEGASGAAWAGEQSRVLRLNRAVVLERLGAWRESLALLSALAAEPEPDRAHAATLTVDLAVTYRNLGDPRTAERLLARAIDELRRLDDRPALANALLNLGLAAELNLRDPARARDAYEQVRALARGNGDAIAQVQALVGLARIAVAQGDAAGADALASEAVALSASIDDPEARWTALDAAARAARAGGRADEALDRFLSAIEVVEELRDDAGPAAGRAGFLTDKRGLFAAAIDLASVRAVGSGDRDEIARALAIVERAKARELLDAAGVRSRPLDAGGLVALAAGPRVVVEYFVGEAHLWRFELGAGSLRLADLGAASELVALAAAAHAELARGELSASLDRLGPRLLDGLRLDREELAVAPDGQLRYLPFAALPMAGGDRLIDRVAVVTLPSASLLAPDAGTVAAAARSYVGLAPTSGAFDPRTRAGLLAARFALSPLPASAAEVAAFAARLSGDPLSLVGANATVPALRAAVASGARVVHLAAHTVVDERLGGDGAAVFLAPAAGDDGLLAPRAIAGLPLRGALVLLSGCSTALGSTTDGEALTTLAGSFLAAGASGVVASLWEVGDRASAALMAQLAHELARGARPAAALRTAQRRLAAAPGGENPAVWASFVLVGDAPPPFPAPAGSRGAILLAGSLLAAALGAGALAWKRYLRGSIVSSSGSDEARSEPSAPKAETRTR